MSKINIQPLSRLISSSKIIDELMPLSSITSKFSNYKLNKQSLKEIQKYHSNHNQKYIKEEAVSIYHQLRQSNFKKDIVSMARLLSPLLFKQWRINTNQFKFYNNMVNVQVVRIRINKQELDYGVWGQVLIKYIHQSQGTGYIQKHHLLEKKLMVDDSKEGWRIKVFQN